MRKFDKQLSIKAVKHLRDLKNTITEHDSDYLSELVTPSANFGDYIQDLILYGGVHYEDVDTSGPDRFIWHLGVIFYGLHIMPIIGDISVEECMDVLNEDKKD